MNRSVLPVLLGGILAFAGSAHATEPLRYVQPPHEAPEHQTAPTQPKLLPSGPVEVDILVGYTEAVADALGDRLPAFVEGLVKYTNEALARSDIAHRLRLIGLVSTDYRETGISKLDIDRLQIPDDGHADDLHLARNELGADIVALLIEVLPGTSCGTAYLYDERFGDRFGFTVLAYSGAARGAEGSDWESCFAHEVAHLLGAHHQPRVVRHPPIAPDGHAYCRTTGSPRFRTIVAYDEGCPVPSGHYSNPDVSWQGHPTGTRERHNNARVMSVTAPVVAAYRPREPVDITTPLSLGKPLSWYVVPPRGSDAPGFIRVENLSDATGVIAQSFPVDLDARAVRSVRVGDIAQAIGPTEGGWVLYHTMPQGFVVTAHAYARGPGWIARTDRLLPADRTTHGEWRYRPAFFNPARNMAKRSMLRIANPGRDDVEVRIETLDDDGHTGSDALVFTLAFAEVRNVSAEELESSAWDTGTGKWRPLVRASGPLAVINLITSPNGYVASLP